MAAGFWSKVKGVFGRIGTGIKEGAKKLYNFFESGKASEMLNNVAKFGGNVMNFLGQGRDLVDKGVGAVNDFKNGKSDFSEDFGIVKKPVLSDKADIRNNAVIEKGQAAV